MKKVERASRLPTLAIRSIPLALVFWGISYFLHNSKSLEPDFLVEAFFFGFAAGCITNWIGFRYWESKGREVRWGSSFLLGFVFTITLLIIMTFVFAALDGQSRLSAREFFPYLFEFIMLFWLPSVPLIYLAHRWRRLA